MSDWTGKTPTADEWREILEQHSRWLRGDGGARADLAGANLAGADLPDGDLIGWKKCAGGVLAKLRIPVDAKRSHAFGRKCRAEYADVLEVIGADVGVTQAHGPRTEYRSGQRVTSDSWDADWTVECSHGGV